jgi:hypothetical protein
MDDKSKRIDAERKIMLKLLGLNPQKKVDATFEESMIRRTVKDLAFMRIELDELQKVIMSEGWQDTYQNGENQSGTKSSPAAKSYLDVQKLYNSTVRHLKSLAEGTNIATDQLMDFLG